MWVEPELLHSGGDVARSGGQRVLGGAAALSAAPIGSTIFGDFDAARSFHQRLSAHRTSRVEAMRGNHLSVPELIGAAGGDPWLIDDTIQAGVPIRWVRSASLPPPSETRACASPNWRWRPTATTPTRLTAECRTGPSRICQPSGSGLPVTE
jgi:hypothetical protein